MFVVFWIVWGLLSLFWAQDKGLGLHDVVTLVFALGLLLTLLSLHAYQAEHLDKLRFGWLLALVATGVSALLEIVRGHGLPSDLATRIVVSGVALGPRRAA